MKLENPCIFAPLTVRICTNVMCKTLPALIVCCYKGLWHLLGLILFASNTNLRTRCDGCSSQGFPFETAEQANLVGRCPQYSHNVCENHMFADQDTQPELYECFCCASRRDDHLMISNRRKKHIVENGLAVGKTADDEEVQRLQKTNNVCAGHRMMTKEETEECGFKRGGSAEDFGLASEYMFTSSEGEIMAPPKSPRPLPVPPSCYACKNADPGRCATCNRRVCHKHIRKCGNLTSGCFEDVCMYCSCGCGNISDQY